MSGSTDPVLPTPSSARPQSATQWLEALVSRECDGDAFVQAMQTLFESTPDGAWEVLSQLDQCYRLGKIDAAEFQSLKSRLQDLVFASEKGLFRALPRPATAAAPAAHHTIPTPPRERPSPALARPGPPPAAVSAGARDPQPARSLTPRAPIAAGDLLRDRYRIQAVLGRGGMGTVFEAIDQYRLGPPDLSQRLAIKVLHSQVAEQSELLKELQREFQYLQSLSHPNIVRVHEFDRDGDLAFLTMELLSGSLLSRLLATKHRTPFNRAHALAMIRDIGSALAYAHSRGVVHGDIKPQNIFITVEGEIRVLDFGASHTLIQGPWISDFDASRRSPSATPAFASCEVLEGQRPDTRDDLYSFACVAYLLLTGKHPFNERSAVAARAEQVKLLRPEGITRNEWLALRDALSWDRLRRPSDLEAWLRHFDLGEADARLPRLSALMAAQPTTPRRLTGALLAVAGLLLVVASLGAVWMGGGAGTFAAAPTFSDGVRGIVLQLWDGARRVAGLGGDTGMSGPGRGANDTGNTNEAGDGSNPADANGAPVPVDANGMPMEAPAVAAAKAASASPAVSPGTAANAADDGATRVELAADLVDVSPADPTARITVRRHGSMRGEVSFHWWTEPGTAKPGDDFVAFSRRTERIPAGRDAVKLLVPVVSDPTRRQAKNFYIAIGDPSAGVALGTRRRAMVIIPAAN